MRIGKKLKLIGMIFVCITLLLLSQSRISKMNKEVENFVITNNLPQVKRGKKMIEYKGWIYYSNREDRGIYRKKTDGTITEKISDIKSDYMSISNDFIFYRHVQKHAIYRMNLDGSENKKIYEGMISELIAIEDELIFVEATIEGSNLYSIKGNEKKKIIDKDIENVTIVGDWIYYKIIGENYIERFSRTNSQTEVIVKDTSLFVVAEKNIYFYQLKKGCLCEMNLETLQISIIKECVPQKIEVIGEKVFYSDGRNIFFIQKDKNVVKMLDKECTILDFCVTYNGLLYTYIEKKENEEFVKQDLVLRPIDF